VIDAAPMIARLLMECPGVRMLATSRMPLHISGEHEFPVLPLEMPSHGRVVTQDQNSQYQAVSLFIDRAQAANPAFDVTSANAPAIAEICHRLEGLPLAIELAAARCRILSPHALLERLEHRLPLLTGGARDLPARQQTIRNTIAWSHDLLSTDEQRLYQQLSVFVGGWTLEAAFAVAGGDELLVLDGLTSLVDRSLVQQRSQPDDSDGEMRFSMLETVREFGLEQLAASGDTDDVRARHAAWAVALVETADPGLRRPDQPRWFRQLMNEQDNLRAAMRWTLSDGDDPAAGARIIAALVWFWFTSDQFREGREWLRQALVRIGDANPAMRARLQMGIGLMDWRLGDAANAVPTLEESLRGLEAAGDFWNAAFTLHHLGHAYDDAGNHDAGVAHFNASIGRFREIGSEWGIAVGKNCLGRALLASGTVSQARALLEESLASLRIIGDAWFLAAALHRLGDAILAQGDLEASRENYRESLAIGVRSADEIVIADALFRLAQISTALGELDSAARLFGGAEALHDEHGITLYEPLRPPYELAVSRLRSGLGEEVFTRLWEIGRSMPRETLIAEAMGTASPDQD
jgi:predicted ATPase